MLDVCVLSVLMSKGNTIGLPEETIKIPSVNRNLNV